MRMRPLLCSLLVLAAGGAADRDARTVAGLDAEVHATWTRLPLRDWTARASALAGRPVILDRRIDPERPVTLTARGEPLRVLIETVAAGADAAAEELSGTVRIVPAAAAGKATRADRDRRRRAAALPPGPRGAVATRRPWRWPAGATPRDLVANAVAESGLEVAGIDAIPHDHLPAADLPPLSLGERLDLVLAHFDRRVLWVPDPAGAVGRIVAIDADVAPDAVADRGPARSPRNPRRSVAVRDEFTLRLEAPLDQALTAICGRLGLVLDLDAAGLAARGIAPGEIVRAEVEKASRDELLDAVLRPAGLGWKIEGDRLRVFAVEPAPAP